MAERADDAVQERFAADEAVIGQQIGAIGEMFARAEADLEMERAIIPEQQSRRDRAIFGHTDRGQQLLDQSRDRKSVVEGKSVSVRVDLGGRGIIKKQKNK